MVTAPTAKSLSYTGKAQKLVNAGSTTGGTMMYCLTKTGTYTKKIPTAKNVGKYRVYYKVVGNDNYKSTSAKYITVIIRPKTAAISSVKNSSSKTLTVKWRKNSNVTGYQIQYSTSSKFTSAKKVTIKKNTVLSRSITKLTKGKTYYVRMRTYKAVNGTNYHSVWSTAVKVKISK